MAKIYIRIKGYELNKKNDMVNIVYVQWDGQCICTSKTKEIDVHKDELNLATKATVHRTLLEYLKRDNSGTIQKG